MKAKLIFPQLTGTYYTISVDKASGLIHFKVGNGGLAVKGMAALYVRDFLRRLGYKPTKDSVSLRTFDVFFKLKNFR